MKLDVRFISNYTVRMLLVDAGHNETVASVKNALAALTSE